jgi:hypothetical protein
MNIPARAVLCTAIIITVSGTVDAASISGQGTWESTLQGRDLNGNGLFDAYYDTVLDITWLADANYAGTGMTWDDANAWAAGLNIHGITGWRLPTLAPINGTSFDTTFSNNATTDVGYADANGWTNGSGTPVSEMGHMFYVNLGNLGRCTPNDADPGSCEVQDGWGLTNSGPFSNIQFLYWTDTKFGDFQAWTFQFNVGAQNAEGSGILVDRFAWAVHEGDVGASEVPVPAAVWLFASGLLGLMGVSRKRQRC